MISERTARLSPTALAQFHTRNAPSDVRWQPSAHLFELEAEIQAAINQPRGRLAISLPPRFGKTTLLRYVMAHALGQNPDTNLMYVTHSGDKAAEEGGKVRSIAAQTYQPVFGLELDSASAAKAEWKIAGHANGGARFTGTDGDLMGRGFNLGIVDDPAGKIDEIYNSDAWNKLAAWYDSVFLSRAEPGASVILCMHRWATDDLIGQLTELEGEAWRVVNFPAIRDGRSLWPERWAIEELEAIRQTKTAKVWAAQYLGEPEPEGGRTFQPDWITLITDADEAEGWISVRGYDCAASQGKGDYSVGALVSYHPAGRFYCVRDVVRGQWGPGKLLDIMQRVAEGDGPEVAVRVEEEPGSSGKLAVDSIKRHLSEYNVQGVRATGSKESRWIPMSAAMEHGRLTFAEAGWNKPFFAELLRAPGGKHDDQIDAVAIAFNALQARVGR